MRRTSARISIRALYDVKNCVHTAVHTRQDELYIATTLSAADFLLGDVCCTCPGISLWRFRNGGGTCEIWTWSSPRPEPRMDRPADSRLFFASGAGRVTDAYLSVAVWGNRRCGQKCPPFESHRRNSVERTRKRSVKNEAYNFSSWPRAD